MKPSDGNNSQDNASFLRFGDISLESPQKGIPLLQSRIELHKEDPFSLKVIEGLEKQGLFIRWRYGYRLANRYEVRRIHSGGMGIVWIVEDLFDNRKPYAAKSVKPFFRKPETDEEWERRENAIQRFLEECKIWVDLEKHRHIVHAEFLEKIEGVPLVMSEYIEGGDLTGRIEKGPMPIETVIDYAIQFCIGMEYANQKGVIVHRDVKPGNIMVTTDGILKVSDFGLTKAIRAAEEIRKEDAALYEESQSPIEGAIISVSRGFGTSPYMAPEQFSERLLKHVKHSTYPVGTACDIFAFGLVLYEMIKGKHAYWTDIGCDRETWDNAHRIASSLGMHNAYAYVYFFLKSTNLNITEPITGNKNLDNLILKCLKKDPDERYKSFTELKEELLRIFPTLAKGGEGGFKYKIIEDPPQKPNYKHKGKTAFILGREEDAIKFYDKALEENPADTDVWLEKGLAMAEMGKLGEFGVCMEVIPYIKVSKKDIVYSHEVRVFGGVFSNSDLKMFNDISKRYPINQKMKDYIYQCIDRMYDEQFKDLNPQLTKFLNDLKNVNISLRDRRNIARTLGKYRDSSIIPILIEILEDKDPEARMCAVIAIGELKDSSTIPALIKALKDKDADVRMSVIAAIEKYGDPSFVPSLVEVLKNKSDSVRVSAAWVLGKLKGPSVIPVLIKAFKKKSVLSRFCIWYLERFKKHSKEGFADRLFAALLLNKLLNDPRAVYTMIVAFDKYEDDKVCKVNEGTIEKPIDTSEISDLIKSLMHEDIRVRYSAIKSLSKLKEPSLIPVFISFLDNEDEYIRWFAAYSLGELKERHVIPDILKLLKHENYKVRQAAIWALEYLEDISVIPKLMENLKDENIQLSVLRALRHIWSKTEKEKTESLKHSLASYSALEWNKKGLENLEAGNKEEARKCFEKAISIDPDWQEPRENLEKCNEK